VTGTHNYGDKMINEVYNRHVLIEPLVQEVKEERDSLIALPDDYKKPESPYTVATILDFADDCTCRLAVGTNVILERRMIIEVEVKGEKNYLVLENYIYGSIEDETD
jgi:hypothetical protein